MSRETTNRVSPFPRAKPIIDIISVVSANPERYAITNEDRQDGRVVTVSISSMPRYMNIIAARMDATITLRTGQKTGFQLILRCALESGIGQLESHTGIKELLRLKQDSHLINCSGTMLDEVSRINDEWRYRPHAPGGVARTPGYRMPVFVELNARITDLSTSLGASKSLVMITAFAFGYHDQAVLLEAGHDAGDYAYILNESVNGFNFLINIRIAIAELTIQLMQDNARAREVVSISKRRQKLGNRSGR